MLPNLAAGCSMADMAHIDDVLDCWDDLQETVGDFGGVVPITYMNSTAAIKALCGRNGGIVCTSSNAPATFRWAFERGERVLFLPDQHLGRNTALKLGNRARRHAGVEPVQAVGRPHGGCAEEGQGHPVAGPLLGTHPVHRRAD